jgi:hypothetical protein
MFSKVKEDRDKMRELASKGAILVLCEDGKFNVLLDGFKYAAHTILERMGSTDYLVKKSRETVQTRAALSYSYGGVNLSFMELIDAMYLKFNHIVIVEDRKTIHFIKVEDLPKQNGLSEWYYNKRGYFTGKKFGL